MTITRQQGFLMGSGKHEGGKEHGTAKWRDKKAWMRVLAIWKAWKILLDIC